MLNDVALDPFVHRPKLAALYRPLYGTSMLELGNKRDDGRVYKAWFESKGFRHVSIDTNGEDGALPLDLRQPLNLGTFEMVTNIGTSEHVSEQAWDGQVACWRNIVEATHVGSILICDTPHPGHWRRHGTWYPHPAFYEELAALNGFNLQRLQVNEWRPGREDRKVVSARMKRTELKPFAMPRKAHMYHNRWFRP